MAAAGVALTLALVGAGCTPDGKQLDPRALRQTDPDASLPEMLNRFQIELPSDADEIEWGQWSSIEETMELKAVLGCSRARQMAESSPLSDVLVNERPLEIPPTIVGKASGNGWGTKGNVIAVGKGHLRHPYQMIYLQFAVIRHPASGDCSILFSGYR